MNTTRMPIVAPRIPHRQLPCRVRTLIAHARKQARRKRKEEQQQPEGPDAGGKARIVLEGLEEGLPQAPAPGNRPLRNQGLDVAPGDIYPVFAPKPGEITNAPWRWDDSDDEDSSKEESSSDADSQDQPRWNPRTGFMRSAAEVEAATAATTATSTAGTSNSSTAGAAGGAAGAGAPRLQNSYVRPPNAVEVSLTVPSPEAVAAAPSTSAAVVPPASRRAVLTSALGTGLWMTVMAVLFRNYAALSGAQAMGNDPAAVAALLRWPLGLESLTEVGAALGAGAAVTGARLALLSVWQDLKEATDRSNQQVLTNLGTWDILLVAVVSGLPEELLFRGALVPATFPDWRGVLISAAIFGVLHNSGGRNPAFAVWAGGVGAVYGAAYLATGNVWVPAIAHAFANAMSAFLWKARSEVAATAPAQKQE